MLHDGQHVAIINEDLFHAVQAQLSRRGSSFRQRTNDRPKLLGKLVDDEGTALNATHAKKGSKRYRYYVSAATSDDSSAAQKLRLPSEQIERILSREIKCFLENRSRIADALRDRDGHLDRLEDTLRAASRFDKDDPLALLNRATIGSASLAATIGLPRSGALTFSTPINFKKRGVEMRLVLDSPSSDHHAEPDPQLIKTLARAFTWQAALLQGDPATVRELAVRDGSDERYIAKHLPLASLSPMIVRSILAGTQPVDLTSDKLLHLKDLPLSWAEQEEALGFSR